MAKLIILGSSNAVATQNHENTHMVFAGEERTVLVDCGSSPLLRLDKAGVDFHDLSDLLLTHFHPDHVSGAPLLLMNMWLLGRRGPLTVHGLPHTLERIEKLMDFYVWREWPDFYPVTFSRLPEQEMATVLDCADFRIFSSPVHHMVPTVGIRVEAKQSGTVVAYSSDTEPCAEVVRLASGADILIHEAAGRGRGHSSAEQAGSVASRAEVARLYLIHYPTLTDISRGVLADARNSFQGEVMMAEDYLSLDL